MIQYDEIPFPIDVKVGMKVMCNKFIPNGEKAIDSNNNRLGEINHIWFDGEVVVSKFYKADIDPHTHDVKSFHLKDIGWVVRNFVLVKGVDYE